MVGMPDRRPRSRGDCGCDRAGPKQRPAVADRLPHHHRLRRAEPSGQRKGPWRAARRRRGCQDPRGADEVAKPRAALNWPHQPFHIPQSIVAEWRKAGARGHAARRSWIERTKRLNSAARSPFHDALNRNLPCSYTEAMVRIRDRFAAERPNIATRQASQIVIDGIAEALPNLLGGSADLTHSNLTRAKTQQPVRPDFLEGSYIHYGVREHAMAAAMNGIALHGGFIPYGGTFLTFADYSRPAIRLAALMGVRV